MVNSTTMYAAVVCETLELFLIIFIYFVLPSDIAEKFRNASRHTKQLLLWFVSFVYRRTITPERYSCHGFTGLQFSVFVSCISLMSKFCNSLYRVCISRVRKGSVV